MKIEKAKIEQAEEISGLRIESIKKVNPSDNSPEELIFLMKRNTPQAILDKIKTRTVFCAMDNNKILGIVEFSKGEINAMYVKYDQTKKGIGSKLLEFIEKYASQNGTKSINLCSTPSAIKFYEKYGYKLIKIATVTTEGVEMKRHIMEKKI